MHLLAAAPGGFLDEEGIIDLDQSVADIIILSSQDSVLGLLARAADQLPTNYPTLRLANTLNLLQPVSFDLYADKVLEHAKLIVVSLLGGEAYWPYGVEQLQKLAALSNIPLILVPGDDQPDQTLLAASTVDEDIPQRVWRYLREGGLRNANELFNFIGERLFNLPLQWQEPRPLPDTLIYHPTFKESSLKDWQKSWVDEQPVAAIIFYRNHLESANTQAFDDFIQCIIDAGLNPLPIASLSLKSDHSLNTVNHLLQSADVKVIFNTTGFSVASSRDDTNTRYFSVDVPVLQCILAANSHDDWKNSQGLRVRDIAMNIALPEMDGRIISRAISFKELQQRSDRTESDIIGYQLAHDRAHFVAKLGQRWASLSTKPNREKRIALILANYPTKEGRIGNGVGLDTPASTINLLNAMENAGFPIGNIPTDGDALIHELLGGITNDLDTLDLRHCKQSIALEDYQRHFAQLPPANQHAVLERWGHPKDDPKVRQGRIMIAGIRLGETFVGIQPARGFNLDVAANYHDPDLVPPHYYLAFYFWLREIYKAQAVAHIGKHGNLEWLPGKGTGLSAECWPEIVLGPMPHLYPFIVNDPGEGAQAKRRTQAVVIDHLMPPMTRAETYGELQALEHLVDEYYQAMSLDKPRSDFLREQILEQLQSTHLLDELIGDAHAESFDRTNHEEDESIKNTDTESRLLESLDTYLCELKEAQIRDGLHILGEAPQAEQLVDTLIALSRLPRGQQTCDQGILHAIAKDLQLGDDLDPLQLNNGDEWNGPRPALIAAISKDHWRSNADTRERLELLAKQFITEAEQGHILDTTNWPATAALFEHIQHTIKADLLQSGDDEINHFIAGLEGRFIPAGPSGAPTRGRLDCLPTGRNFYSVDTRSVPTPAAWQLGQKSADALILRHLQEHGDYPKTLGLSVWGTATMRTGGDDIAQAFALMGVKPLWHTASNRVTDFEIIPGFILNRPRVDVTLRISGFFRDAFTNVVRLFDAAVNALAEIEEPPELNPIRARILDEQANLESQGLSTAQAHKQSRWRVFGSKPGAYGAGLQGLIDERCWETDADLAQAYLNWGSFAYGQDDNGTEAPAAFQQRLSTLESVLQNQDNREHDILDSDDYYQFQGGMANAVRVLSRQQPQIYHADHANPADPKIRTLQEELARVIRSRAVNPKWLNAIRRHGYKGAFEMAATVDYLFAYDATTDLVADYQYGMVTDAYLLDDENRAFLQEHNPDALQEMAERLLEAMQRGLWENPGDYQQAVEAILVDEDERRELNSTS